LQTVSSASELSGRNGFGPAHLALAAETPIAGPPATQPDDPYTSGGGRLLRAQFARGGIAMRSL